VGRLRLQLDLAVSTRHTGNLQLTFEEFNPHSFDLGHPVESWAPLQFEIVIGNMEQIGIDFDKFNEPFSPEVALHLDDYFKQDHAHFRDHFIIPRKADLKARRVHGAIFKSNLSQDFANHP
jgi:hypothetical protein